MTNTQTVEPFVFTEGFKLNDVITVEALEHLKPWKVKLDI